MVYSILMILISKKSPLPFGLSSAAVQLWIQLGGKGEGDELELTID
jgi:hypothetical protein